MKTLLIYPYFLEERIHAQEVAAIPLGVYHVAASLLERGHEVKVLNWHNIHKAPEKIRQTLASELPEVIGFSVVHANRWGALDIAMIAKELNPDVKVVLGGIGATFLWEHFLTHFSQVDYCVIGEGEHSFPALLDWLKNPEGEFPKKVPGIAFRNFQVPEKTPCADFVKNLDALPDPSKYFAFQHVALSRGCPGKCTFCGSPRFWQKRIRFHSANFFVNQLERLYQNGVNFFFFSDDTFALKKDLAIEVCKEICRRNLPIAWAAICRVRDISENLLYWMRRAGCTQISYGIESGSAKIRRLLNKPIDDDMIQKAFRLTTAHGILARAYFIYGCPEETDSTIDETLRLIEKIKPLSTIFYIMDIFPGTDLYEQYKQSTGATDDIWLERIEDILYFETDPDLSREQILEWGKKLRSGFYRMLPKFTETIALKDDESLYACHADFLSRLAMTFSHGDYSQIEEISSPELTAMKLFEKALTYHTEHRAFLGLGIVHQKKGNNMLSEEILEKGLVIFPNSQQLEICLGVAKMNMGKYREALSCFEKYRYASDAAGFAQECKKALGEI